MPIYEYRCATCGFENEYLQKVSDPLLTDCPSCGKPTFTKLVSAAGFQLKGNGWYATDFKNSGKPAAKPEKEAEKSGTEKSGTEKSEPAKEVKSDTSSGTAPATGASPASS
jgi:putative FmdB family regulatory protein